MQQLNFEATDHRGISYLFRGSISSVTPLRTPKVTEVFVKTGLGDLPITDETTRIKVIAHFTQAIITYASSLTDKATSEA